MSTVAILPHESANRVYAAQAVPMLVAELAAIAPSLTGEISNIDSTSIGGLEYVTFTVESLGDDDHVVLSNLAGARALYDVESSEPWRLTPIEFAPTDMFADDLITTQRYPGKTNEQFTHLLVNVTRAPSVAADRRHAAGQPIRLLDPVAGRGTTLNRGLMYGFDSTGIEVAEADVDQYRTFITTYLKDHRVKHRNHRETVKKGPLSGSSRFWIEIGTEGRVEMIRGDTNDATDLLKGRKFELVVADLPYGVQHRAAATQSTRRSPIELVDEAIGGWVSLMAVGAAIGLAWNLHTLARDDLAGVLDSAGLTIVESPYSFRHTVDSSIERDVIVATKTGR